MIEPIVVFVGKVVVPVSNQHFHSKSFKVGLHVEQAFHAGDERIGRGVVDGVDEVDQVCVIICRFVGFEVVGSFTAIHHGFIGLLAGAFPCEIARP